MPFPDADYLERLIAHVCAKVSEQQSPLERFQMHCNATMNWIADYLTDPNVRWTRETIATNDLYLTGTNPVWNGIIIDQCERSPARLANAMRDDPQVLAQFKDVAFDPLPILIRFEKDKLRVLDGMHRVVAAIRDGRNSIEAYVARHIGEPRPACEPHVVYDLLKAYHRGLNTDRTALITALRFLRRAYGNVDDLLRHRFIKAWVPDDEIQAIIAEALNEQP